MLKSRHDCPLFSQVQKFQNFPDEITANEKSILFHYLLGNDEISTLRPPIAVIAVIITSPEKPAGDSAILYMETHRRWTLIKD